jgi:hypothetical protein
MDNQSYVWSGTSSNISRMPDIFDIGRRYQAIGNRYREIFAGAR